MMSQHNFKEINTIAVIVNHNGLEILSNGTKVFPAGGPDNNPFATIIHKFGGPLGQTEHIEDAALKQSFRSAMAEQIRHAVSVHTTALSAPGTPVLTCHQLEEKIIELQARAAQVTSKGQRDLLEMIIKSDMAILHSICQQGFR